LTALLRNISGTAIFIPIDVFLLLSNRKREMGHVDLPLSLPQVNLPKVFVLLLPLLQERQVRAGAIGAVRTNL
jgi:hypothetical protein